MVRLIVRIIETKIIDGSETVRSEQQANVYSPEVLEKLVMDSLRKISSSKLVDGNDIQVTVSLTSEDDSESIRPALCLSKETIKKLSEIGASFDFDPYI